MVRICWERRWSCHGCEWTAGRVLLLTGSERIRGEETNSYRALSSTQGVEARMEMGPLYLLNGKHPQQEKLFEPTSCIFPKRPS